jgi:rare lipoprotein A
MAPWRGKRFAIAVALTGATLALSSCAKKKNVAVLAPPTPRHAPPAAPAPVGYVETGVASWYGYPYHGRRAANGEIYDMEQMTAAHRTLAFETFVEVENLDNGKIVTVRITDRGPFVDGRIIDLSKAGARAIDMIGPGTAKVRMTVVSVPPGASAAALFAVQVGAFRDQERAERVKTQFEQTFGVARIVRRSGDPVLWRVLVGSEPTQDGADSLATRIRAPGQPAFVVRIDN